MEPTSSPGRQEPKKALRAQALVEILLASESLTCDATPASERASIHLERARHLLGDRLPSKRIPTLIESRHIPGSEFSDAGKYALNKAISKHLLSTSELRRLVSFDPNCREQVYNFAVALFSLLGRRDSPDFSVSDMNTVSEWLKNGRHDYSLEGKFLRDMKLIEIVRSQGKLKGYQLTAQGQKVLTALKETGV